MSVQDLKRKFTDIIQAYQSLDPYEVRRMFAEAMRECEIQQGWDESSKLKPWSDDELRTILSDAPTKENCLKHARAFNRGYGAIEQIYRWAATSNPEVKRKRPNDSFVAQIKRVAKQLGWRAYITAHQSSNPSEKKMHDYIVALVDKMLDLKKRQASLSHSSTDWQDIEKEIMQTDDNIDSLVYDLYGLTEDERRVVEGEII